MPILQVYHDQNLNIFIYRLLNSFYFNHDKYDLSAYKSARHSSHLIILKIHQAVDEND